LLSGTVKEILRKYKRPHKPALICVGSHSKECGIVLERELSSVLCGHLCTTRFYKQNLRKTMSKQLICSACGHVGKAKTAVKGNLLIEIILWLSFLLPGLIYSVWRHTSRYSKCALCQSTSLIPVDTPVGQKLLSDQGKDIEEVKAIEKADMKKGINMRVIIYGTILAIVFLPILISLLAI